MDADAFGYLRPPPPASVHVAEEHRSPPFCTPHKYRQPFALPTPHGSGVLPLVDGLAAVHVVTGHLAGRAGAPPAAHIEASAGRAVAAAFPHPQGRPGGQGAVSAHGRIARPFSAPFPPTAPSSGAYPLTPVFLPCGAVASRTGRGIMCHGIGGQGAWQPSLRSGRLRRPARAEWDNSRRRTALPAVPRADLIDWWKPARR